MEGIMTARFAIVNRARTASLLAALVLAGCSSLPPMAGRGDEPVDTTRNGTSTENTAEGYKRDLAHRITEVNSTMVYPGRPQALLRSVVVIRYAVDGRGNLVRSDIQRSNQDAATEATALAALRNTAPFP